MKKLYLVRHAEAVPSGPEGDDKERKLSADGIYQSLQLGMHLKEHDVQPDFVLCSTAKRTIETLNNLMTHLNPDACEIKTLEDLYLCSANDLLHFLYKTPDDVGSVMILAHNPGVGELARALAQNGHREKLEVMRNSSYPTAGLTAFKFEVDSWGLISDDNAWLCDFVVPKAQPLTNIVF